MYKSMMSFEVNAIEKEVTDLNRIVAKYQRILKSITTESVFKSCMDYLINDKASCSVRCGCKNETISKSSLLDKESREQSLNVCTETGKRNCALLKIVGNGNGAKI